MKSIIRSTIGENSVKHHASDRFAVQVWFFAGRVRNYRVRFKAHNGARVLGWRRRTAENARPLVSSGHRASHGAAKDPRFSKNSGQQAIGFYRRTSEGRD